MCIRDSIKQTIPTSQREYDPDLKMWFVGESYIQSIVDMCSAIPDFDVCFTPKPEEVFATKMHSKEEDYATFKRMLSLAHIEFSDCNLTDFKYAKRAYLRAVSYTHLDVYKRQLHECLRARRIKQLLEGK